MREIYKSSESITAKFSKAALFNNRAATATKIKMNTTFQALELIAKTGRWGALSPENLTYRQFKNFIHARIAAGISARSLQNEASHVRRALAGVGREEFAQETCANSEIDVPSASRKGNGKVVEPDIFQQALEMASPDTRAMLLLQRRIGLREREVVMCQDSLISWEKSLLAGGQIEVLTGTKGGKPRVVFVRPDNVEPMLDAVRTALDVMKDGRKHLVQSISLKAGLEQYRTRLKRLGLHGENSSHALRRAFAMDQYQYYLDAGYNKKMALARLSNDLGHGDGRGRWVYANYLRVSLAE